MTLVKAFLANRALPYKEITSEPTMPNIISTTHMSSKGRHLMFNGHLDVLPAGEELGWLEDPYSGSIKAGRVWGRGASDMKAGVVAMLFAYAYLSQLRHHLRGKLSITLASDEETGMGRGTGYMFERIEDEMNADCVLSAEPSGLEAITFSSKGYLHFSVEVHTRGAISGYPNASKSAIRTAIAIIRDLEALEKLTSDMASSITTKLANPGFRDWLNKYYGDGSAELIPAVSFDVGTIEGGSSPSLIASDCAFSATVVIPVGVDPHSIFQRAKEIVASYPDAQIHLEGADAGDVSNPDHEMTKILQDTVVELGRPRPQVVPDVAISDLRYWRYRGVPGFWYGLDGKNVGAANESIEIAELLHVTRTYVATSVRYLMSDENGS